MNGFFELGFDLLAVGIEVETGEPETSIEGENGDEVIVEDSINCRFGRNCL